MDSFSWRVSRPYSDLRRGEYLLDLLDLMDLLDLLAILVFLCLVRFLVLFLVLFLARVLESFLR